MTRNRLRELLRERVADETMPDGAAQAWRRAHLLRRRRRLGAAAGVVAATVAVSGGVAVLDSAPPAPPAGPDAGLPSTARPTATEPTATEPTATEPTAVEPSAGRPDATARGVPVWFSPDPAQEQELSPVDAGPLPAELDAAPGATALADEPVERAVVALTVFGEVRPERLVVVTASGERRGVDLAGLRQVTKANGYRLWPTGDLSPDGRFLLFPQDVGVRVLRLADATWSELFIRSTEPVTTYGTRWVGDEVFALPDGTSYDVSGAERGPVVLSTPPVFPLAGRASPYGRAVTSPGSTLVAQTWWLGTDLPVRDPGTDLADPEGVWVDPGRAAGAALSITWPAGGTGRWKECCPVAGWLSDDVVVYESRSADPVLVAWTVGTTTFRLLARITGFTAGEESYVASWADFG